MESASRYDVDFVVQYFQIEQELMTKWNTDAETANEYSKEDIEIICDKLYQEEIEHLLFSQEDGLQRALDILMQNEVFAKWIGEKSEISGSVCISLFSYPLFHLTHRCICEQFKTGCISETSMSALQTQMEAMLTRD